LQVVLPHPWHPHAVVDLQHANVTNGMHPVHEFAEQAHTPLWHVSGLAHAWVDPHPPQVLLSVCSLTQAPLHKV
jgi:hypothetical protein